MKFLIIFVIFCSLDNTWAAFPYEMFQKVKDTCLKEYQLNPKSEKFSEMNITEEQILRKCFYETIGYVKDGLVQKDVLLEQFKNTYLAIKVKYMLRLCGHIIPNTTNNLDKLDECYDHTSGDYFVNNWKVIFSDCREKVNLSRDEYLTLQYLPVKNVTETMKLYAKCALERHGFLKDNRLQEDVVLEVSKDYKDAKHLKAFVKECKDIKEENENDNAFQLYKCMQEIEDKYLQSTEDEYKMVQKSCLKEKQLTPNQVFSQEKPSKSTPALTAFADCVFAKMDFIKDGNLQFPVIYQKFEYSKFSTNYLVNITKCVNSTKNVNNRDMLAYNFGLCIDLFYGEHFLRDWEKVVDECDYNENQLKSGNPTELKYYAACIFKKLNFLKDNNLQENVILKSMDVYRDKEYLENFLSKCKQIKDNDHGVTAVKLFLCMENIIKEYKNI